MQPFGCFSQSAEISCNREVALARLKRFRRGFEAFVDPVITTKFWFTKGRSPTTVEFVLTPRPDNTTGVRITETGFQGDADEIVKNALGSTHGFTFVLAGLNALFEHPVILNLAADRFPDGLGNH